jgi:hypothetical protein
MYLHPYLLTPGVYDEAVKRLDAAGAGAPAGRSSMSLRTNGQIQGFDLWDAEETFRAFARRWHRS